MSSDNEEKRCRTCRWWAGGIPSDMPGACRRILDVAYTRTADGAIQLASVGAGGAGIAMLLPYPDFGCVLWESKADG
jgi:hypothetical protein